MYSLEIHGTERSASLFYVVYVINTKNRNFHIGIFITLAVFLFYLGYSFYVSRNVRNAVMLDFLIQLRPYLTFFIVSQMTPVFSEAQKKQLKRLCFYLWLLFIPIGMYGLYSPDIYYTVMEQPEDFVTGIAVLSLVYLYCSDFSIKARLVFILMLSLGLSAGLKFFVFFFMTCVILLFFNRRKILKSKIKTGIGVGSVIILMLYLLHVQISSYLFPTGMINGSELDFTARTAIYQASLKIFRDFLPLGSGFASFASDASGLYYSPLYANYGLNSIAGLTPQAWSSVSFSFYPSLAQFGIIGLCLYLIFWMYIMAKSLFKYKQDRDIQLFAVFLVLVCFVFFENISDDVFTSNKGYFIMMFVGVLFGNIRKDSHLKESIYSRFISVLFGRYKHSEEFETEPKIEDDDRNLQAIEKEDSFNTSPIKGTTSLLGEVSSEEFLWED